MKSDASSEGNCSNDTSMKLSATTEQNEVEKLLRRCKRPWLYFYPRARAHSSLLACYGAPGSLGVALPQQIRRVVYRNVLQQITGKKDNVHNSTDKEVPLKERLTQCIYPSNQMPLVSDSTVGMVEAVLRHLQLPEGTSVFMPGMLLYPYCHLLELFDAWKLRVIGYDVDYVTMHVKEDELRNKMRNNILRHHRKRSPTKKDSTSCMECPAIVLLIGVGARFLTNGETIVHIARNEFRALTLELHPVTAASFKPESFSTKRADVHITSMDTAGEMGGAIAMSTDPLLTRGILARLEERPLTPARKRWVSLARHVFHVMVSDGMSFQLAMWIVQWWSFISQKLRSKKQVKRAENVQANGTVKEEKHDTFAAADCIFEFLMASQVEAAHIGAVEEKRNNTHSHKTYGQSNSVVTSCAKAIRSAFSQPHRGVLQWMMTAITSMQQRIDADCISLWEFLSRLRHDVEVVSAGEPTTPQCCVGSHSDSLLLRVHKPLVAAQALRTAGFDAAPAVIHLWDNNSKNSQTLKKKEMVPTLREIVILSDCPESIALAQHALFLPLYKEMRWKNREKLHRVMQTTFPASLFSSPSAEFQKHVNSTPSQHAYRSKEVEMLLRSWKQSCKDTKGFFTDPQPLLLWTLFGPVPGYLLSKL